MRIHFVCVYKWCNILMALVQAAHRNGLKQYLGADGGIWSITLRFFAESSTLAPW